MILKDALLQIPEINCTGNTEITIYGISCDSRSTQSGELFVAIKGEKTSGTRFIAQAVENGAVAIASEENVETSLPCIRVKDDRKFLAEISRIFYEAPCAKLKLVAITGTKGKTTTAFMIDSIYAQAGISSCLMGTIEMKIREQRFSSVHTTPEAPDLSRFFNQAVQQGCTHGVLEVSSHALAMKRVYGAKFTVGIFMNLTRDHLDFHQDMETYFQAKKLLFTPENGNGLEIAVINKDDPFGRRLAGEISLPVMTFGFAPSADITIRKWDSRLDGTDFVFNTPAGEIALRSRMIGKSNAYNTMAAIGAAIGLGFTREQIRAGIEALAGVPGRMERVDAGQDFLVIVDYAHSPASLENLLETAKQLPHRKLITVFGCGGDRDRGKRPVMGEIAARLSDFVIATSDNPRSEEPSAILREIEPGLRAGQTEYAIEPDRRRAIQTAVEMAGKDDIVVIAGKGHEDYQLIGGKKLSFDDRQVAFELIAGKNNGAL